VPRDAENRANLAERLNGQLGDLDSTLLTGLDRGMACAAELAENAWRATAEDTIDARFRAGLGAVLEAAAAKPEVTRLCLVEAPGLGSSAVARKEAGLQRFVEWLERQLVATSGAGTVSPLAPEMVVGGIYEVLQRKARTGEIAQLPALGPELCGLWLPALRGR